MARKSAPKEIKILRGDRASRINSSQPVVKSLYLKSPDWLDKQAKETFEVLAPLLHKMNVVSESDKLALEMLCDAYSEYRIARKFIQENGSTYKCVTANGIMNRTRPEVAIVNDSWKRVRSMMSEFGLTPSSRNKVSAIGKNEENPLENFLNNG